ncbi:uncharacterized protein UV8b_04424 [Ustilaginoidea virens]|uniref:Zn(2)-C6 fungal-type domain-containing protein n=2 Tax=Ustilaginoidea virens TaxID=1159556 RepID=A0A8E5HRR7_USTVR|nr:uncharacterized protein UV8b_04424 [Ustilaginoidea virens]QUC20183.1 hypothetical protein UV8b_04424 [Ustilaginoidea virens]
MEPPYGYRGSEDHSFSPSLYSPRDSSGLSHDLSPQSYMATPGSSSFAGQQVAGGGSNAVENQSMNSPKSLRKSKGHVASACVPCKRAHLRCDAQRPCSRCLSNGKDDACVDVQHKKRGRPRLRDDRDTRFDPIRPTISRDASPRRALSLHPSSSTGSLFDEHYHRHQSFRPAEIPTTNCFSGRHGDRASSSESTTYTTPLSASGEPPEPVAYLNMDLEFVKASPTFWDILGLPSMVGRSVADIVLPAEFEKVSRIRTHLNSEQKRREPNYLPPILGHGFQSIQGLGFSFEDFGRFPLNFHDHLAFVGANGYVRPTPIRAGLAKEGSFYFVVLLLVSTSRQPQEASPVLGSLGAHAGSSYQRSSSDVKIGQRAPFDPIRYRPGESPYPASLSLGSSGHVSRPPNLGDQNYTQAGRPAEGPLERESYSSSPFRVTQQEPSGAGNSNPRQSLQLPPIRSPSLQADRLASTGSSAWKSQERSSRVDIGGLIHRPGELKRLGEEGR